MTTLANIEGSQDLAAKLLEVLQSDPMLTNRALSQKLGCSVATVAALLKRLNDHRIIRVLGVTSVRAMGYKMLAVLFLKVRNRLAHHVGEELANVPEVISIFTAFGQFDLVCIAVSRDQDHLRHLILSKIATSPGVASIRSDLSLNVLYLRSDWGLLENDLDLQRDAQHARTLNHKADAVDLQILQKLQGDARTSKRAIAKEIGVSEGTVRYRINEMESEGLLRMRAIVNPAGFGLRSVALVGLEVDPPRIEQVATSISELDSVSFAAITLGRFDVVVNVMAESRGQLAEIVEQKLMGFAGVQATNTFEAIRTVKYNSLLTYEPQQAAEKD